MQLMSLNLIMAIKQEASDVKNNDDKLSTSESNEEHPMKNANDANNVNHSNSCNCARHEEPWQEAVNICEQRRTSDEEC